MDKLRELLKDLKQRVENLEKGGIIKTLNVASGVLVIPILTADPGSPINGQCWYNSTSNQLKVRNGGTTKAVTLS